MHRLLAVAACAALTIFAASLIPSAGAQTADGVPPSVETICNGLVGAQWGLCNAYCEATDCGDAANPHADQRACDKLLANYLKKSGGLYPPCTPQYTCQKKYGGKPTSTDTCKDACYLPVVNLTFCPSATCDASICSECERTDKGFICSDTKKCGDGSTCTKVISTDTATLAYCLSADKAGTLQCKALPSSGPTCNAQYAGNKDACYLKGSAEGLVYCEATGQCCDVCPKPQPCTGGSQCTKPDGTIGKCDPMSLQCY